MPNPPANTIKMYARNQGRILWSTIYRNANGCNKRRRIRQGLTCSRDADYNTHPHRNHHLSAPALTLCSWVETITLCPFSEHPLAKRPPDRSLQFETASVHTMILHQQQREYEVHHVASHIVRTCTPPRGPSGRTPFRASVGTPRKSEAKYSFLPKFSVVLPGQGSERRRGWAVGVPVVQRP